MGTTRNRIARVLVAIVVCGAVVVAVGSAALQTRRAKDALAGWLNTLTGPSDTIRVRFGTIDGHLPFDARVSRVSLFDADGEWLTIDEVELDAVFASLLRGRIRLAKAHAAKLTMPRLPRTDGEDDESEVARRLPMLVVDRLKIDQVYLGPDLLGGWSSGPLAVRATGSLRLSDLELAVDASVVGTQVEPLDLGGTPLAVELLHVEGSITGPADEPSLRLHCDTEQLLWRSLSIEGLTAELTATPGEGSYDVSLRADLPPPRSRVSDPSPEPLAEASGLEQVILAIDAPFHLDVRTRFEEGGDRLHVRNAAITAGNLHARLEDLVLADGRMLTVASWAASIEDLSSLSILAPAFGAGSVVLDGTLDADLDAATAQGEARLELSAVEPADARLVPLVGGASAVAAALRLDANGDLHAERIRLQTAGATGSGDLVLGTHDGRIAGTIDLDVVDVAVVNDLVGADLRGGVHLQAELSGSRSDLSVDAILSSEEIGLVDAAGLSARIRAHADGLPNAARGTVRANLVSEAGPATLGGSFWSLDGGRFRLEDVDMQGASVTLRGLLTVDPAHRTIDGRVAGTVSNFATAAGLLGYSGAGSAKFELLARSEGERQDAALVIDGNGLSLSGASDLPNDGLEGPFRAEALAIRFQLDDLFGTPAGSTEIAATDALLGDVRLATLRASAKGVAGVWDARVNARGSYVVPFDVQADGTLDFDEPGLRAEVSHLTGDLAGKALRLAQPAVIVRSEGESSLSQLDLRLGQARVSGDFASRDGTLDGALALSDMPLDLLQIYDRSLVLKGVLGGTVRADAASGASAVVVSLTAADVAVQSEEDDEVEPFAAQLDGAWRSGSLDLDGRITSGQTTDLRVGASFPMTAGSRRRGGEQVQIDARGRIDLALLEGLVNVGEDTFHGTVAADLSVTGTVDDPRARGTVIIQDGGYESAAAGVSVRDIALRIEGDGHRLVLRELTGNDGNGGKVRATGSVDLSGGLSRASYEAEVLLDSFWIVRVDEAAAKANGRLTLAGRGDELTLAGRIKTISAELRAPARIPPAIVTLPVVEENIAALDGRRPREADTSRELPVTLDITLELTDRVFFRAPDLDTEWKGALHIGGKVESPRIEGTLTIVRGSFNALGIRFGATQGKLTFDGSSEIDPSIDFVAEASRNGIVARVRVSGTASDFRLDLTSDPSLPTDEIVSRLLYGESPSNLTPAQSVQLAAAVARLTQAGTATPLDWVRRTFGVDRVSIESADSSTGGSVVSVGKYLGRGLFVSIDQGLTGDVSKASVEVELTPQINLESEIGTDSQGRLGVNWRWRY